MTQEDRDRTCEQATEISPSDERETCIIISPFAADSVTTLQLTLCIEARTSIVVGKLGGPLPGMKISPRRMASRFFPSPGSIRSSTGRHTARAELSQARDSVSGASERMTEQHALNGQAKGKCRDSRTRDEDLSLHDSSDCATLSRPLYIANLGPDRMGGAPSAR
jgi:hypothetical protein